MGVRIPDDLKTQLAEAEAKVKSGMKDADEKGSAGDIAGSQAAMEEAEKNRNWVEKTKKNYSTFVRGEHTCEACGVRYLLGKEGDPIGMRSVDVWEDQHMAGKLHKGWTELREKLIEYREIVKKEKDDSEREAKDAKDSKENGR